MRVDELPGVLAIYRDRAAAAAPPVAKAMADTYKGHLTRVTLRRTQAMPGQFGSPAPPGGPPAWRTGALAGSVTSEQGPSGPGRGTAFVGPHVIYAAAQEFGAEIYARHHRYMHWRNSGGEWWKKHVTMPPRPYMEPARDDVIADGSLQREAMLTFRSLVGPY